MKATLNQLVDIRNGYQFRGKVVPTELDANGGTDRKLPPGVVWVVQIKDFDDNRRLQTSDLAPVQLDADPDKYAVHQGDVLFLARGHRLFATAITEPIRTTVATGYFFILRLKTDTIDPAYLAWYVNQAPFQANLRTFMKGTMQPLVSRKDIADLEVEIPSLETQRAIVALEKLRIDEQQLLTALRDKRSELIQTISIAAARRSS